MLVDFQLISSLAKGDGPSGRFNQDVPLARILKHMTEFAQSIRTSHDGKSLGQEVEKTCGRTRRAGRFMNLWFSKCEGYHKPKIMTAFFDMLEFTFVDFLEALIISLVELSRRQEWEERYSTFLALSDLFPCWIRALRNNNGDYEGYYDYEILISLCKDLASMMRTRMREKIVEEEDFKWIQPAIELHILAVDHFEEVICDEDFLSVVRRTVQICTYHPELVQAILVLGGAVKLFHKMIIKFPSCLEKVRSERLLALLTLTDFAMGGTARAPICNLMGDIVLLPGNILPSDLMNRLKPVLLLSLCDDLGDELVYFKCMDALKFAIQNFPELFTDEETVRIIDCFGALEERHIKTEDQTKDLEILSSPTEGETINAAAAVSETAVNNEEESLKICAEPVETAGMDFYDDDDYQVFEVNLEAGDVDDLENVMEAFATSPVVENVEAENLENVIKTFAGNPRVVEASVETVVKVKQEEPEIDNDEHRHEKNLSEPGVSQNAELEYWQDLWMNLQPVAAATSQLFSTVQNTLKEVGERLAKASSDPAIKFAQDQ